MVSQRQRPHVLEGRSDDQILEDYLSTWPAAEQDLIAASYSAREAAQVLGVSEGHIPEMLDDRKLLGWRDATGKLWLLRGQFTKDGVVAGIPELLTVLTDDVVDGPTMALWLISPDPGLRSDSPLAALAEGFADEVVKSARVFVAV